MGDLAEVIAKGLAEELRRDQVRRRELMLRMRTRLLRLGVDINLAWPEQGAEVIALIRRLSA